MGRFGLFVERGGRLADGTPLLPDGWIKQATTWVRVPGSVTPETPDGQYGFQWWYNPGEATPEPGWRTGVARQSFWAEGIYGQAIAIDPVEHVVMVQWSAWPAASPEDGTQESRRISLLPRSLRCARGPDLQHSPRLSDNISVLTSMLVTVMQRGAVERIGAP